MKDRRTARPMPAKNSGRATALQENPVFDHMHTLACIDEDHGFSTASIRYSCLQLFHPSDAFQGVQVLQDLVTDGSWLASAPPAESSTVVPVPEARQSIDATVCIPMHAYIFGRSNQGSNLEGRIHHHIMDPQLTDPVDAMSLQSAAPSIDWPGCQSIEASAGIPTF